MSLKEANDCLKMQIEQLQDEVRRLKDDTNIQEKVGQSEEKQFASAQDSSAEDGKSVTVCFNNSVNSNYKN